MPVSRFSSRKQLEHLRLHRHIERCGRLVGDQHLGVERDGHGDQRRAGACRRRTGADSRRCVGGDRGCARAPASRWRAPARLRPAERWWARSTSMIWSPIVEHGIERRQRVLEHHRDLGATPAAQRLGREAAAGRRRRAVPCPAPRSPAAAPGRARRETSCVLPEPNSPTTASVSPRRTDSETSSTTTVARGEPGNTVVSPLDRSTGVLPLPRRS